MKHCSYRHFTTFIFSTPKRSWSLWTLATFLWCGFPFRSSDYFAITQMLGHYPPESDSIILPIAGNFLGAIVGLPFWIGLCVLVLRRYPGSTNLACIAKDHPKKEILTALVVLPLLLLSPLLAINNLSVGKEVLRSSLNAEFPHFKILMFMNAFVSCMWGYLWIAFRATVSHKRKIRSQKTDAGLGSPVNPTAEPVSDDSL